MNLGLLGENLAVEYLQKKGYVIIERNWRFKKNEIDIIVGYKNEIIIVEVKTRSNTLLQLPHETVSIQKQKNIIKATDNYIRINQVNQNIRFDVITLVKTEKDFDVIHIIDAFSPNLL